ncbi:hypothetical protein BgAZ_100340 [Babesia gibsoni]|uniref:Uncharacterized protein n=1 Tax=Babesia gibsoni TaxID=33632 RepID=A0AAD8PEX5_BABGI|nr:hypothetical protein BgAZ_100340 [Babesia gibsoni]
MAQDLCKTIEEPKCFKEIIDLMAKIQENSSLRNEVFKVIWYMIHPYIKDSDGKAFYAPDHTAAYKSTGYIPAIFEASKEIRDTIIVNPALYTSFGKYQDLFRNDVGNDVCTENLAQLVVNALPDYYASLYLLYFHGLEEMKTAGGGSWSSDRYNVSNTNLHKWLLAAGYHGEDRGGFSIGAFGSETGKDIAVKIKNVLTHKDAGALQNVLFGVNFVVDKWNDALLGHSVLFLHEYCSQVASGKMDVKMWQRGMKMQEMGEACKLVKDGLDVYVGNPRKAIQAVAENNSKFANTYFDESAFGLYSAWVKLHIGDVITSLKSMKYACDSMPDADKLCANSEGPFKYGFVLMDEKWKDVTTPALPTKERIKGLITDTSLTYLEKLSKTLREVREFHQTAKNTDADDEELLRKKCELFGRWFPKKREYKVGRITSCYRSTKNSMTSELSVMPMMMILWFFIKKIF